MRDFAATLRARDGRAFERLCDYNAIAYFLLAGKSTGKMRDYPDALLLWSLQLEWMRRTNHPMLAVLKADYALANEELGEISLSEFSKGVKAGSVETDAASMSKAYKLQGAGRDIVHDFHDSLGLPQEANYHEVTSRIHRTEIQCAVDTVKELRKGLHTHVPRGYDVFEPTCTTTTAGKKSAFKVLPNEVPTREVELTPFFEQPPAGHKWDVAADLNVVRARYFNQPPKTAYSKRDSESDSDDDDPAPGPRPIVPVATRAATAAQAAAGP